LLERDTNVGKRKKCGFGKGGKEASHIIANKGT